jgi:hypothetical protein
MHDGYRGRSEPVETLVQTLRLEDHDPEICSAEAELVRLMAKHQHQVGNFALIPELREAAERLLQQHENGPAT